MSQPIGPTMPTIGRIIHIADPRHGTVAAIVTGVWPDGSGTIHCTAFWPDGNPSPVTCPHAEPTADKPRPPAGTWHWPAIR